MGVRLDTKWVIDEPLDFEYKQYILLDYLNKIEKEFEDSKIYPAFQELSIHLANVNSILEKGKYITLNRNPEEIDDEILLEDLKYNDINVTNSNDFTTMVSTAEYGKKKFSNLFLMGKGLWSLVYDSIILKPIINYETIKENKPGSGFFYFFMEGQIYIYQYHFKRMKETNPENKCVIDKIYSHSQDGIDGFDDVMKIISKTHNLKPGKKTVEERLNSILPVFEVEYLQKFPMEGTLLSMIRRKVMNYVFQTIRVEDLKEKK